MPKPRVLVVDDAVVIRRIVSEAITNDPELELAGWAANGKLALARIEQLAPDCVTLDVEMPEMDGIRALCEIRKLYPKLPVIMFSTLTEKGAQKTLEALAKGATDYVAKPANVGNVVECIDRLRVELIPKIKAYTCPQSSAAPVAPSAPVVKTKSAKAKRACEMLCIASSTGGPKALSELIPALPGDLRVPVLVVQHMPPIFTEMFAKRLNDISQLKVEEGTEGREIVPGHVYIAPGGKHMEVRRTAAGALSLHLTEDPPENSCRPAADVLFRSAVKHLGASVFGVVLTGMGADGLRGCRHIAEAGGQIIVQDAATSVVWGMPGFVAEAGIANQILPLCEIAGAIVTRVSENGYKNGI